MSLGIFRNLGREFLITPQKTNKSDKNRLGGGAIVRVEEIGNGERVVISIRKS